MKICASCKKSKPNGSFFAHNTNTDKLSGKCKTCLNAEKQERIKSAKQNMNHRLTTVEASTILVFLGKIKKACQKSVVISTMIGIDRKEMEQIESLIKRLEKPTK